MSFRNIEILGNGLRTDHPVQGVAFVDDAHIPVADGPGVEAVGRNKGQGMWGRLDPCYDEDRTEAGWTAFTTDPVRNDLAWVVRYHPEHGRSVLLIRDEDASGLHMSLCSPALLWRAGGYWWDGRVWSRPWQMWDTALGRRVRRVVPSAVSVTAADRLGEGGNAVCGRVLDVTDVGRLKGAPRWLDDLALWAAHRAEDTVPLDACVVSLMAPELAPEALVSTAGLAEIAGISAGTLRAYSSRGEAEVPEPQTVVQGKPMWSRKVAEEWAEARKHTSEAAEQAVTTAAFGEVDLPMGISDLWERLCTRFMARLWENPPYRGRWALRWRNRPAVQEVAKTLAWDATSSLKTLVPMEALGHTLRAAMLHELARDVHTLGADDAGYSIGLQAGRMLHWLVCHDPATARWVVAGTVADATTGLGLGRDELRFNIRAALASRRTRHRIPEEDIDAFLTAAFSPASD